MTVPRASGRQVFAPGDTFNGNVKVVEFPGSFPSSCPEFANPTAGASASAAVHIAAASFMENLVSVCRYILSSLLLCTLTGQPGSHTREYAFLRIASSSMVDQLCGLLQPVEIG